MIFSKNVYVDVENIASHLYIMIIITRSTIQIYESTILLS